MRFVEGLRIAAGAMLLVSVAWLLRLQLPFSCPMALQRRRCIWGRRFGDADRHGSIKPAHSPPRLDVLAKLLLTEAWFSDIAQPGEGVIAVPPPRSQEEVTDLAMNLVRHRRGLIQLRGVKPLRPCCAGQIRKARRADYANHVVRKGNARRGMPLARRPPQGCVATLPADEIRPPPLPRPP
jgi:hypothetical protein